MTAATDYATARPATYAATLAAINQRADGRPVVCVQLRSLAFELGKSPRTISRHMAAMRRDGVVTMQRLRRLSTDPSTGPSWLWTGWRVIFRRRAETSGRTGALALPPVETSSPRPRARRAAVARALVQGICRDVWRGGRAERALLTARTPVLRAVEAQLAALCTDRMLTRWLPAITDELWRRDCARVRARETTSLRARRRVRFTPGTVEDFEHDQAISDWQPL